jgi:hypothetical protein
MFNAYIRKPWVIEIRKEEMPLLVRECRLKGIYMIMHFKIISIIFKNSICISLLMIYFITATSHCNIHIFYILEGRYDESKLKWLKCKEVISCISSFVLIDVKEVKHRNMGFFFTNEREQCWIELFMMELNVQQKKQWHLQKIFKGSHMKYFI